MKVRIEFDEDMLKKVSEITMTKYDNTLGDIECMIEDLISYYYNLEEEFEDYKQYVQDNYKVIPDEEQYAVDNKDFI